MSNLLRVEDRARDRAAGPGFVRRIMGILVSELPASGYSDLSVFLVNDAEMAELNQFFVQHSGTTDVITLDYEMRGILAGEIYICVPEAKRQAKRFQVSVQQEIARYIIHGVLHILGYDDITPAKRRRMKTKENGLVTLVERRLQEGERHSRKCAS